MVFKRRDRRPVWQMVADFFYPRGGWARAYTYVKHRLHRLPDPPHRIARGIFAGVLTSFTPFFGLHFIIAAVLAKAMRGNIIAALLATFFGNPITFPVIATVSLQLGNTLLGRKASEAAPHTLIDKFLAAGRDFWDNFGALFTEESADWSHLAAFYSEVMLPYLIGGLGPGIISAMVCYYLSVPVITAYKHRRKGRLKAKIEELKAKKAAKRAEEAAAHGKGIQDDRGQD